MSGVACGFLLSLPLSPLATCGHSGETVGDSALPAFVAMAIVHAAIVFWLGDHVQARWALLVSLVGHLHAASGSPTPEMCWAMFGVFVGFCAGVSCSIVSLLLPFPRLVSEQMASRIGESHRQVMRYHAVLSCAFVVEARPHVLYSRADRLEERGEVPLILIDAAERSVDIPVLQFPLWLAFAAGPGERLDDDDLL